MSSVFFPLLECYLMR